MSITNRLNGLAGSAPIKVPCRVATTTNISLLTGLLTIDGITTVSGDRVLVKDQTDETDNGIYVADTGDWNRSDDFDGNMDVVKGTLVTVNSGTVGGGTIWRVTTDDDIVVGTSSITFEDAVFSDSSTVAFTPSGTGAVQRTAQAKMRDIPSRDDYDTASNFLTARNAAPTVIGAKALIITGDVSGETGLFRSDVGLEIRRATDAGMSLFQGTNPGVTNKESFIAFGAYDSAGNQKKTGSISSLWSSSTDASTGVACLRLNATYAGGASDDVAYTQWGGNGAEFFGNQYLTPVGDKILKINGKGYVRQTADVDPLYSEATNASFTSNNLTMVTTRAAGTACRFLYGVANGVGTFSVTNNGNVTNTNNSYGAISDPKLKTKVELAGSQLEDVLALSKLFVKYNLISDPTGPRQLGLMAAEVPDVVKGVDSVSPGLIVTTADMEDFQDEREVSISVANGLLDSSGNPILKRVKAKEKFTNRRETGTQTLGIQYSIAYLKGLKATGELIAIVRAQQETIDNQATLLQELEKRITALEA